MTKYISFFFVFFFNLIVSILYTKEYFSFQVPVRFLSSNFLTFVPCKVRCTHKIEQTRNARFFYALIFVFTNGESISCNQGFLLVKENLESLPVRESPRNLLKSSNKGFRNYVVRNVCRPSGEFFLKS